MINQNDLRTPSPLWRLRYMLTTPYSIATQILKFNNLRPIVVRRRRTPEIPDRSLPTTFLLTHGQVTN